MADQFEFELTAKDNVTKVIDAVTAGFKNLAKTVETASSSASRSFDTFKGVLAGELVVKALEKTTQAAERLFDVFVTDGIKAASQTEQAFNDLSNALARNKNFSEGAAEAFKKFADGIEDTTTIQDQAVLSAGALLESLTGLSEKGLEKATKAAIQLSAITGKDLNTTTLALAKTAENGSEALKRLGVNVGNIGPGLDGLAKTVERINSQFAGAAESKVNTYIGSITQLGNTFESLQKAIGATFTENLVVTAIIKSTSDIIKGLSTEVKSNATLYRTLIASFSISIVEIVGIASTGIGVITDSGRRALEFLKSFVLTLNALTNSVAGIIDPNLADQAKISFEEAQKAFKEFEKSAVDSTAGGKLGALFAKIQEDATKAFDAVANGQKSLTKPNQEGAQGLEILTGDLRELVTLGSSLASSLGSPLEQFKLSLESLSLAATDADNAIKSSFLSSIEEQIASQQNFTDQRLTTLQNQQALESAALEAALARDTGSIEKHNQERDNLEKKHANERKKIEQDLTQFKQAKQKEQLANTSASLNTIATLQQSSAGELFRIGQAAALAQATIDGVGAVIKAYNTPFPLPLVLVPLTATAVAVQIAKIASAQPPKLQRGITEVPAGFGGDTFPTLLNTGERVVPASSNSDLKDFIAENRGSSSILQDISSKLDRLNNQIIVNVGNREIINEVRAGLQDGRLLVPV